MRKKVGRIKRDATAQKNAHSLAIRIRISMFFYIKSKIRRQALFWHQKISIPICRAGDTKQTVMQYEKEGRNIKRDVAQKNAHILAIMIQISMFFISNQS